MLKYVLQRFLYMIMTIFVIASATFFLMKMLPGTPYDNQDKMSPEQIEMLDEHYGLNDPVVVQYANYMWDLLHLDFGVSYQQDGREVSEIIVSQFIPSAVLGVLALVFGSAIGLLLGIIAALKHNTFIDRGSTVLAVIGVSIPSFVFAGLLQYMFAVKIQIFPILATNSENQLTAIGLVLPTLALSVGVIAQVARFTRSEMIEVMNSDYITLAKAKGLSYPQIVREHAIRNALIPVLTILGPLIVNIMTGSMVVENIFGIPGLGQLFVSSVTTLDYPVIMGLTIFYSSFLVFIIFVIDIIYGLVDPRIRVSGGGS